MVMWAPQFSGEGLPNSYFSFLLCFLSVSEGTLLVST